MRNAPKSSKEEDKKDVDAVNSSISPDSEDFEFDDGSVMVPQRPSAQLSLNGKTRDNPYNQPEKRI